MPTKVMTAKEVAALREQGAQVLREPREVTVGELAEVVAQLKAIASKRDDALRAAVENLAKVVAERPATSVDLAPLAQALAPRAPVPYEFSIVRSPMGRIQSVVATPMEHE